MHRLAVLRRTVSIARNEDKPVLAIMTVVGPIVFAGAERLVGPDLRDQALQYHTVMRHHNLGRHLIVTILKFHGCVSYIEIR